MKNTRLLILASTLFLDLLGFGLIIPLIPVYITHYGGKPWIGGVLLACFSVMQFIFSPIWGRLSDKVGRRPLILMSLIGSATSFLAFGLAPNLLVLFIARVAAGILSAASLPTAQAYIADVTPPEKRAGGMAVLGASFGLGFALGPAIGGYLGKFSLHGLPSIATPALFAACLAFVNFVWAFFMLPESHTDRSETQHGESGMRDLFPAIARSLQNPQVSKQLTVFTFVTFAFTAVESSFSWLVILRFHEFLKRGVIEAWTQAHPEQAFDTLTAAFQRDLIEKAQTGATSSIFLIVGVSIVLTQVAVMGGLAKRIGENKLVMFGSFLLTCSLLGIAFAPTLTLIKILSAGIAIGSGVLNPSLSALITQAAGPKERGTLSGTQQGLGSLARIIAPPINNVLVGVSVSPLLAGAIPFLSSSVLMATAFGLSLRLKPLDKTPAPEGAPGEYPVRPGSAPQNGHAPHSAEPAPTASDK